MQLPPCLKTTMSREACSRPLLVLLLLVAMPLQTAAHWRSPHRLPPLGRSVQQGPGQTPQIIDVQSRQLFQKSTSSGHEYRVNTGLNYGHPPGTITITGSDGTVIIITPGSSIKTSSSTSTGINTGINTGISTGINTGPSSDTYFDSQAGAVSSEAAFGPDSTAEFGQNLDIQGDIGVTTNDGSSFSASSVGGSEPGPRPDFNSGSSFITADPFPGSGSTSNLVDGPASASDTSSGIQFHPNPDPYSLTSILSSERGTDFENELTGGSGEIGSSGPGSSITSTLKRFGTNLNRNTGLDTGSRVNSAVTDTNARQGTTSIGSLSSPRASTNSKRPVTTKFGPHFGTRYGHTRRKTCKSTVDENGEFPLRLLPYNIPVVGPEAPPNGCPRDQIRFGTEDGPCTQALIEGTCGVDRWILYNNVTNLGECRDMPCPPGTAFVESTGLCHDPFEANFCPGGRVIATTATGESACACLDGWFPDRCGDCQLMFSNVGCPSGLAHQFNNEFEFRCLPSGCSPSQPVQLPEGKGCSSFGSPCLREDGSPGVWGFLTDSLAVECIAADATVSRRRRRRDVSAGDSGSRFRRAVFGNAASVNSCLPGARTDFNTACRSAVVPSSSGATPSGASPSCPRVSNHYLPPPRSAPRPRNELRSVTHALVPISSSGIFNGKRQMLGIRQCAGQMRKKKSRSYPDFDINYE